MMSEKELMNSLEYLHKRATKRYNENEEKKLEAERVMEEATSEMKLLEKMMGDEL